MIPHGTGSSNFLGALQVLLIAGGVALALKPGGRIGRVGLAVALFAFLWMAVPARFKRRGGEGI